MKCVSCGMSVEADKNWVEFKCPKCEKASIIRCGKCKRLTNKYECPECGFIGP